MQKLKLEKVLATINISCPLNICDELRVLELTTLGKGYTDTALCSQENMTVAGGRVQEIGAGGCGGNLLPTKPKHCISTNIMGVKSWLRPKNMLAQFHSY